MPELPEVEVVRRGLNDHLVGRAITAVRVHHLRAVRRHDAGPADLTGRLQGATITGTDRRGKYLWLLLSTDEALVVHLGMSGQMLLGELPDTRHLRIAATLDDGMQVSFVDQRTFGGWQLTDLVTVDGAVLPAPVAHIARDPLDPRFDGEAVVEVLRRKHSEIKRQLLDQTVVSGIGNIYADEALWRAGIRGTRMADRLSRPRLRALLAAAGVKALAPPPPSKRTLELGTKYSPETACLPFKMNIGNYIEALEAGADTILTCGGAGPCRLGYYAEIQRAILADLGYDFRFIVVEPKIGSVWQAAKVLAAKVHNGRPGR